MPELRTLQRLNLSVLVLLGQLIQSAFVALVIAGFLIVFGVLALPGSLQEGWIGRVAAGLATLSSSWAKTRLLSQELVTTSVLLGSVVGLYFTGLAVTDSGYRTAHFDRLVDEVRHLLTARTRSMWLHCTRRRARPSQVGPDRLSRPSTTYRTPTCIPSVHEPNRGVVPLRSAQRSDGKTHVCPTGRLG